MRAVLIADTVDRDAGLLGDFLGQAGSDLRYIDRERVSDEAVDADLVVLLGSNRSAHYYSNREIVETEISLIRRTLSQGTPIMGICYGAQVLARALGGDSRLGPAPECGWTHVDSVDVDLCPPGRWGQMHRDVIIPASSSTVIGHSPVGVQAFIDESAGGRAIGWQFHPELTSATFRRWVEAKYSGTDGADIRALLNHVDEDAAATKPRTEHLFRHALEYLRVPLRQPPPTEAICILGYN